MAISYSVSTNIITVIAYTEAVPANFTDIYNADKAGTLSLHARTGISGTDGAPVATNRAERPADYIVLGGASNDLYITIANWNGTTATIRITGTDRDGAAQTEDIVVTANGVHYTTKWFKTITHTQVTAFTATSFDYDLIQGQWGVGTKTGSDLFRFACKISIGDGSTATWFADTCKQVEVDAGHGTYLYTRANANFRLGALDGNDNPYDGCSLTLLNNTTGTTASFGYQPGTSAGNLRLYDSILDINSFWRARNGNSQIVDIRGCIIKRWKGGRFSGTASVVKDTRIHEGTVWGLTIVGSVGELADITVYRSLLGFYYVSYYSVADIVVTNLVSKNNTYLARIDISGNYHLILLDADVDVWNFDWLISGAYDSRAYRKYSFDLKVIDKDNAAINGATVKIWDKDSNLIVDTTTNASGVIATQTITRGYYNEPNGNTLQESSPHLIKIEKAGYTTYEADFTLGDKTDWTIALQTNILRNPSMGGGMV